MIKQTLFCSHICIELNKFLIIKGVKFECKLKKMCVEELFSATTFHTAKCLWPARAHGDTKLTKLSKSVILSKQD